MKIYNIENTDKFIKTLTECKGEVELINKSGSHIALKDENLDVLKSVCTDNTIKELEINFSDGQDAVKMFQFLTGMTNVA